MAETGHRRETLVARLSESLGRDIQNGAFRPGERLPSEAQLCRDHGVSRTVVREAVAALRAEGLVEARQGAGVFVKQPNRATDEPFRSIDFDRMSSMVELLELRTAVEVEAAGLASLRRSAQQEEAIVDACRSVQALADAHQPTAEADFALHLAIADATNNPRFREFLLLLGPSVIPRRALEPEGREAMSPDYIELLNREHERIVAAILDGDGPAAQAAMRDHLHGSLSRYRSLLRSRFRPA